MGKNKEIGDVRMRVTMVNSVVCKELTEKVSFRQKLKGDESSHADIWRKTDLGKGKNKLKKSPT